MNDGYTDAAAVPVPDAGDDTLRLEIAAALILHDHPNKNSLTRPDDALTMLRNDPDFFVCADALSRADALLPLIREHTERAVEQARADERERLAQTEQAYEQLDEDYGYQMKRAETAEAAIERVRQIAFNPDTVSAVERGEIQEEDGASVEYLVPQEVMGYAKDALRDIRAALDEEATP